MIKFLSTKEMTNGKHARTEHSRRITIKKQ